MQSVRQRPRRFLRAELAVAGVRTQPVREIVLERTIATPAGGGTVGATRHHMLMPPVDRYMTREPYSVASTDTLARVRHLMTSHMIRHLPVIDKDKLVGVISDRDVAVIEHVPGVDLARVEVARLMTKPLTVWGHTGLDEVSELMTNRKADCVVVQGGHGVQGIFTAVDALSALTDLLRRVAA